MVENLADIYQIYKCKKALVLEIPQLASSIDAFTYVGNNIYLRIFIAALFVNKKQ